jgi:CBS domain-containing protein
MELAQWLAETTCGEVTFRNVITLRPQATLAQAASTLLAQQITGAPVVDAGGTVVGVLSASDLLLAEARVARQLEAVESSFWNSSLALPMSVYADRLAAVRDQAVPAAERPVAEFMTRDLVSVTPDTPLGTAIQRMVDAHIHRLVVVNEQGSLVGIVSTTDVLAALMRAGRSA